MLSRIKGLISIPIHNICLTHCTFEYIGNLVICDGISMEPTLYTNNVLITERFSKRFCSYRRGEIVVAVSPLNPRNLICKRIIAIPGDRLNNHFVPVIEEEIPQKPDMNLAISQFYNWHCYIPRGYVWIEGDNKEYSSDSRYFGPIPIGLIKSRVVCRIWPLNQIRFF